MAQPALLQQVGQQRPLGVERLQPQPCGEGVGLAQGEPLEQAQVGVGPDGLGVQVELAGALGGEAQGDERVLAL
ncbi:hypothetical protein Mrose_02670 [Calidithermus roseus]|uniref:Uncharacterized protein n=1 Tax=Calidithermus roseus TaxID=1644118 RepID=A0A399EQA1_9DEIN|nr:hypothetical protein Mrose_02670 [Calidithermus roseus]